MIVWTNKQQRKGQVIVNECRDVARHSSSFLIPHIIPITHHHSLRITLSIHLKSPASSSPPCLRWAFRVSSVCLCVWVLLVAVCCLFFCCCCLALTCPVALCLLACIVIIMIADSRPRHALAARRHARVIYLRP